MPNHLKYSALLCIVDFLSLAQTLNPAQNPRPSQLPAWKEARIPAAKGTRVSVPQDILAKLLADTVDDPIGPCNREESAKLDAYRVILNFRKPLVAIAVWGKSSCYCGATGNCQFWVFVADHGKHRLVLDTSLVRDFGFVKVQTRGYRDLVLWSHDSAQRSPARLLKFDGKEYMDACGWEEEHEFKELPNGRLIADGDPKILNNTCESGRSRDRAEQ